MSRDYELIYDGLYRWSREGQVADALLGGFLNTKLANRAFELYELKKNPVSNIKGDVDLDSLTSKADLVRWAEANEINVPEKLKQPSAIKKFLMGSKD
tara:strand:+ start:245 stop:538 length:294 start_codon:yes stop_codon:yes gene_type:complete